MQLGRNKSILFCFSVAENTDAILMLDAGLKSLNDTMALLDRLPLGTIIAWNEIDADSHPSNWVECDGRLIEGRQQK